jgi:hypothetical protein
MERRRELALLLLILAFAGLLRLGVALRSPAIPAGDGIASQLELAENLRRGQGFSTMRKWTLYDPSMAPLRPEANRQPAMSVVLAGVFAVVGPSFPTAQAVSLLLGLGCLAVFWLWTRSALGGKAALLAVAAMSVNPLHIYYSTQPDSLLPFTMVLFLALIAARRTPSPRRALVLGALCGLSWLFRTQGSLLAVAMLAWVLLAGERRLARGLLFCAAALLVMSPWMLRNLSAFGDPLYSQGGQFLLNENHWAAWEVRSSAPSMTDLLVHRGPLAVASYLGAGVLRVLEPFTWGSLHRGEPFGQPALLVFVLAALWALRDGRVRREAAPAALVAIPTLGLMVLHEHSGRYLAFVTMAVVALGSRGLLSMRDRLPGRRWGFAAALALAFLPMAGPSLTLLLRGTDRSEADAAGTRAAARWIAENAAPDQWVVAYPNVELMVWRYRRPTLTWPNDYEMLVWPCLERHGVRYAVVDADLPRLRPRLADRWMRDPAGGGWLLEDPPPFLTEVWRSESGRTLIYEMTGPVPEGFEAVDSLPRDNLRALPPR